MIYRVTDGCEYPSYVLMAAAFRLNDAQFMLTQL
jgi:hypothetical protein